MESLPIKQQFFKDLDDLLVRLEIEHNKKEEIIFTVNQYLNKWELQLKNRL